MTSVKYIGLDVHKESISICVRNSVGKVVMESVIETKASTILQFIDGLRGEVHVTASFGMMRPNRQRPEMHRLKVRFFSRLRLSTTYRVLRVLRKERDRRGLRARGNHRVSRVVGRDGVDVAFHDHCSGATTDMLQSNDRDLHSTP
jgi:hypothetical protein